MKPIKAVILSVIIAAIFTSHGFAQEAPDPRESPVAISHTTIDDTYVQVVYGQPLMRDRVIFGDLVPFDEVWRTGANEATQIYFDSDVMVNGERVESGMYSVFTIPDEDTWTIILNERLGQWGAFDYNPDYDVLRTEVNPQSTDDEWEPLDIDFEEADDGAYLVLRWENTRVELPIHAN